MCADYAVHRLAGAPAMTRADESPLSDAYPEPSHAIEISAALPVSLLPPGTDPDVVRDWFDSETIVTLPAPGASLAEAETAAADYRRAAGADNTRRAYRTAVARFTDWCHDHGQS